MKSLTQKAKKFAPIAFNFNAQQFVEYWRNNSFIDECGNVHHPISVTFSYSGFTTACATFADGSCWFCCKD